jgi:predicted 2-oxoglutarate/Fe(II)-dependent dioxygenase YbiX
MLLDPSLRVLGQAPIGDDAKVFKALQGLPLPGDHAGAPLVAPVLIAPRVFDADLCERLIALHAATGGTFTGVMRDVGERTVAVMDEFKKRRDVLVTAPELRAEIHEALVRRLFPQIRHAFQFQVTEIERYLVSCYDAAEGGVFRAHRDNITRETANRKFACSINLNGDFEGGDLRFPEFGPAIYRPPVGGAVVFSCGLLHEATSMVRGRRYAFLPFFYDEDGAQTLAAYRRSLEPERPTD